MNEQASAWLTAIEGLPAVHERLKRVVIKNQPALKLIQEEDTPDTLFYLDPTYPKETRTAPNAYGIYEMSTGDHIELLDTIVQCKGKVMISTYDNDLYRRKLGNWTRHAREVANHAAGGKSKARMTEIVYCNY